jgi:hypothetical protein
MIKMKTYKAYILSRTNGTVQIGHTVYQPCTGAFFRVEGRPRKSDVIAVYEVKENSMAGAREALAMDAKQN